MPKWTAVHPLQHKLPKWSGAHHKVLEILSSVLHHLRIH